MVILVLSVFFGCACEQRKCPDQQPAVTVASAPSVASSGTSGRVVSCARFYQSLEGMTVRTARYEKTLMPATPAEREAAALIEPEEYGAYWGCIVDAQHADSKSKTWCECSRGSNRVFEDFTEKNQPVRWVSP